MSEIIKVENLVKTYGSIVAVNGISFTVEKGSLFAFLGTNGAGKSTTIDVLSTLLKKDSGNIVIDGCEIGKDDLKIRKKIGIVFQKGVLDDILTVEENLKTRGKMYGLSEKELNERIKFAVEVTGCEEFLTRRYSKLSGGQKRRADIARAMLNRPDILFLDEPTTGLDPTTRKSIWDTISYMQKQNGMTVFLTTHYMEEAAKADMITIIDKGNIIASGTPIELKDKYARDVIKLYDCEDRAIDYLKNKQFEYNNSKGMTEVYTKSSKQAIQLLSEIKDSISSFEFIKGNMDDVFLNVTGIERCVHD
ncbi:MAG: ATP-binding cassette domain-containing protein [Lachnospiraceae bacterium]|nr:ATP-binding cassette domain-containing protein [Lachnospiraceae bacterium]